jgi:hypothetical protein
MDLKDTIIKQLSAPVKRKGTQEYMTDEDGNIVTSEIIDNGFHVLHE